MKQFDLLQLAVVLLFAVCCIHCLAPMKPGVYFPINEANRGRRLGKRTFSFILNNIKKAGGSVRFVFGFSTGHVGTTSFASYSAYNPTDINRSRVSLLFERAGVPIGTYRKPTWTLEQEIQHVEYYYGPELMGNITHRFPMVRVDLSHSNLFFYRGLLSVLTKNNCTFSFIRIQRNRHELAVSMSTEHKKSVDFFSRDYFRYHPFEAMDRVILKIPGGNATWNGFSIAQRVLWVIDETEARWQALLRQYKNLNYTVVKWSKTDNNIAEASAKIAAVIGVRPVVGPMPHVKIHAGKRSYDGNLLEQIVVQDRLYKEAMKYDSPIGDSGEEFGYYLKLVYR